MDINQKMYDLGNKRSVIRELFEYGKKRSKEIGEENVFDFSLGNPSVEPPKSVENAILEILKTNSSISVHGYTSAPGDMNVREAIANNINKKFNAGVSAINIYMTCGAAASLTISLKALLNKDEECIVFAPYFTEYKVFIENAGGNLVKSMPLKDTFQVDIVDFENKITEKTKAVIINSPNNPSGVVYTEQTIKDIVNVIEKANKKYNKTIYIICDEPYRELVYGDVKVPYLMNYYDNTIICYSYSKSLSLPGERIGYIAVNPKAKNSNDIYLAVCGAGRSLGYVCAPSLFQKVIGKNIDTACDVSKYKDNRDLLLTNLQKLGYNCVKPDGAFYLFVKAFEEDANKFCERAKKHELLLVPCDDFGVEGYVRISYCVPKERIIASIPAFEKLAREYKW